MCWTEFEEKETEQSPFHIRKTRTLATRRLGLGMVSGVFGGRKCFIVPVALLDINEIINSNVT